jgi:hypothetical protein
MLLQNLLCVVLGFVGNVGICHHQSAHGAEKGRNNELFKAALYPPMTWLSLFSGRPGRYTMRISHDHSGYPTSAFLELLELSRCPLFTLVGDTRVVKGSF